MHIIRECHTYPEGLKSLAIVALTWQCLRGNAKSKLFILELAHYYVVGTVEKKELRSLWALYLGVKYTMEIIDAFESPYLTDQS